MGRGGDGNEKGNDKETARIKELLKGGMEPQGSGNFLHYRKLFVMKSPNNNEGDRNTTVHLLPSVKASSASTGFYPSELLFKMALGNFQIVQVVVETIFCSPHTESKDPLLRQ